MTCCAVVSCSVEQTLFNAIDCSLPGCSVHGESMTLDARGWCTGTTQRDGMGREEGGGFRMGNTCVPAVDSFRYLAKPIQYCKV